MDSTTLASLQAIGFATGAALCCLLGSIQWATRRSEAVPYPYLSLWTILIVWDIGNFVQYSLIAARWSPTATAVGLAALCSWIALSIGPLLILRAIDPSQRIAISVSALLTIAVIAALVTAVLKPNAVLSFRQALGLSLANAVIHAVACGILYSRKPAPPAAPRRAHRRWLLIIRGSLVLSLCFGALAFFTEATGGILFYVAQTVALQWAIPWSVLMAAFIAESQYADVVLSRTLRLLGSVAIATALACFPLGLTGLSLIAVSLAGATLFYAAPWLHQAVDSFVDKVILRRPDYSAIAAQFAAKVGRAGSREEVMLLLKATSQDSLQRSARLAEPLAIDIPIDGNLTSIPDAVAQRFMQGELAFLRRIGADAARRLDALALEEERREARLREEKLRTAAVQAELMALRAQVNPHFLFNTLNSIAELISTDPTAAETMTERLAEFFRYTLTRTQQANATIREEMEFARHYLEIEATRFGERLRIEIGWEPSVGDVKVPALILQPLVENAIRHGVGPKLDGGTISLNAARSSGAIQLTVRDNGVGMQTTNGSGVGLQNVRERLRTLYSDRAIVKISAGADGVGTTVTLQLPDDGQEAAH